MLCELCILAFFDACRCKCSWIYLSKLAWLRRRVGAGECFQTKLMLRIWIEARSSLVCWTSWRRIRKPILRRSDDAALCSPLKSGNLVHVSFFPIWKLPCDKGTDANKIKLHFLSLLLSCSFLLGFCACRFIFYLLMHVDVRKSSLWRTNLLRVRIRGKSLQRNEASKWVFFPNGWNPWHWGCLTLSWSLTPSCLSSTAGSGTEASLNIGFISIKLLPSHKQSLLLLEWGYIRLILLNGDWQHHSTIVFFDIALTKTLLAAAYTQKPLASWIVHLKASLVISWI